MLSVLHLVMHKWPVLYFRDNRPPTPEKKVSLVGAEGGVAVLLLYLKHIEIVYRYDEDKSTEKTDREENSPAQK